jgi:zinc transport system ATP-binding protein
MRKQAGMTTMKDKISIEVKDVSYSVNGSPILENIEFSVKAGDYLGIIGPNGGGKTTLLRIILGLVRPDSGEVRILGQRIETFRERYIIGYIPQRAAQAEFYFPAEVEEVVRSGRVARLGLYRRFGREDDSAVKRAMEITGVTGYRGKLIGKLSGGERQRVFIARALAGEPEILFLDEPAVGVDIASQEKFYDFLSHLNSNLGITIIFVSHDVGVIAEEVQTVLCLNHRLICHGLPENYIKEEFLEKVYGRKVSSLLHRH